MTLARQPGWGLLATGSKWRVDTSLVAPLASIPGPYPVDSTGATDGQGLVFSAAQGKYVPGTAGLQSAVSVSYDFAPPGDLSHNYAADPSYASPYSNHDTGNDGSGSAFTGSGELGDGTHVPLFFALDPTHTSAIALNGSGALRITHTAASDSGRGLPETVGAPQIVIPLPPMDSCTVIATIRTNVPSGTGGAMGAKLSLLGKGSSTSLVNLGSAELAMSGTSPTMTKSVYYDVFAAAENLHTDTTNLSAGVVTLTVKIVFDRINVGVYDNSGPTLLRGKQAIFQGTGMRTAALVFAVGTHTAGNTPLAGYYGELTGLSITGTRGPF